MIILLLLQRERCRLCIILITSFFEESVRLILSGDTETSFLLLLLHTEKKGEEATKLEVDLYACQTEVQNFQLFEFLWPMGVYRDQVIVCDYKDKAKLLLSNMILMTPQDLCAKNQCSEFVHLFQMLLNICP